MCQGLKQHLDFLDAADVSGESTGRPLTDTEAERSQAKLNALAENRALLRKEVDRLCDAFDPNASISFQSDNPDATNYLLSAMEALTVQRESECLAHVRRIKGRSPNFGVPRPSANSEEGSPWRYQTSVLSVEEFSKFVFPRAHGFNGAGKVEWRGKREVYFRPAISADWPFAFLDDVERPEELPSCPRIIVETSAGNFQAILMLNKMLNQYERTKVNRALMQRFDTDPGSTSGEKWMRLPGFINHKPGRGAFKVRIHQVVLDGDPLDVQGLLGSPAQELRHVPTTVATFMPTVPSRKPQEQSMFDTEPFRRSGNQKMRRLTAFEAFVEIKVNGDDTSSSGRLASYALGLLVRRYSEREITDALTYACKRDTPHKPDPCREAERALQFARRKLNQ